MKKFFAILFINLLLISCNSNNKEVNIGNAKTLYLEAMSLLEVGNYFAAAEKFEKIEDDFPFSDEAINGLMMSAYSYYKAGEYDDSVRVIDYFVQSNPANPDLDYLQYLKALNYFDRMRSVHKAREITEQANMNFRILIAKYPNNVYSNDAKNKLKKIETYLSGNEMAVARFYFKRKNYLGAINHYENIVKNYPYSDYTSEALYRLIEIDDLLKLKIEALKFYQIMINEHKNDNWIEHAEKIIKNYEF